MAGAFPSADLAANTATGALMPDVLPVILAGAVYLALLFAGLVVDVALLARLAGSPAGADWSGAETRERPWTIRDVLRLAALIIALQVSFGMLFWGWDRTGWFPAAESGPAGALLQGFLFNGLVFLFLFSVMALRKHSWSAAFGMNPAALVRSVPAALAAYVGILPVIFVTALAVHLFFYWAGYPVTLQDVVIIFMEPQPDLSLALLLALAILVAPVVEEMLFRGVLLPALMKKMSAGAAVAVSSLVFSVLHFHLPSTVPLFVLSTVLSLLYIHARSLWAPIMLHALFNGASVAMVLLIAQ